MSSSAAEFRHSVQIVDSEQVVTDRPPARGQECPWRACRNSILNSFEVMRNVLEEAMTRVLLEISNTTTKAYLAECILKTAAQGHTAYNELLERFHDWRR